MPLSASREFPRDAQQQNAVSIERAKGTRSCSISSAVSSLFPSREVQQYTKPGSRRWRVKVHALGSHDDAAPAAQAEQEDEEKWS